MSNLGRLGRGLQEGSLYGLLFCLPFSIALIEIASTGLFLGWMLERADLATRRDTIWIQPHTRWLAFGIISYLAVCLLSVIVSDDAIKSLHGFAGKWLQYLLLLCVVADTGRRTGVSDRCARVIVWSSVLVVIEAISQELLGRGLLQHHSFYVYGRISGPYYNPSDLGTYVMVIIPIVFTWMLIQSAGNGRKALLGLIAVLLVCLLRTQTRGAWFGFEVGLFIFALVHPRWRPRIAAVALGGALITCGVLSMPVGHITAHLQTHPSQQAIPQATRVDIVGEDAASPAVQALPNGGRPATIQSVSFKDRLSSYMTKVFQFDVGTTDRVFMWQAAIRMIKDRPWLGHGVNTFMGKYLDYWVGGERMPRYAHNCYLQIAAETGLIGLGMFVIFLGCFFTQVWHGLRRLQMREQTMLLGVMAGLVAFLVQAAFDTNFYSVRQRALFWVLAGLALGVAESHRKPETPAS